MNGSIPDYICKYWSDLCGTKSAQNFHAIAPRKTRFGIGNEVNFISIDEILSRTLQVHLDLWGCIQTPKPMPREPLLGSPPLPTGAFLFFAVSVSIAFLASTSTWTEAGAIGAVGSLIYAWGAIQNGTTSHTNRWAAEIEKCHFGLANKASDDDLKTFPFKSSLAEQKEYAEEVFNRLTNETRDFNGLSYNLSTELQANYIEGEKNAVQYFMGLVAVSQPKPAFFPKNCSVKYEPETKTLICDSELPSPDDFENTRELKIRQLKSGPKAKLAEVTPKNIAKLYDQAIYELILGAIYWIMSNDFAGQINSLILNGWTSYIHKATGKKTNAYLVSLQITKDQFRSLALEQVDAKDCFRYLKGIGSPQLYDLVPIPPIMQLNNQDGRFITPKRIDGSAIEGTNLAAMDWEDFEHLVRDVFERRFSQQGIEVKITRSSRDRGVDAIAFDPDPVRGGKIVIQAKRYSNTVDVAAVRDLYGTVHNEGANKGILVTTSGFGPDAYEFCKGKPLTLISGGELLQILMEQGYKAHIDLEEARKLNRA